MTQFRLVMFRHDGPCVELLCDDEQALRDLGHSLVGPRQTGFEFAQGDLSRAPGLEGHIAEINDDTGWEWWSGDR